jgi:putative ABC transport system permease protein
MPFGDKLKKHKIMILSIAWRNVWRSKTRSIVIIVALTLGLFAGIFNISFYKGMVDQRIESAISTESSHIQIHHKGYLDNPSRGLYITDAEEKKAEILAHTNVKAVSNRIVINGMIQSANSGSGAKIIGVNPEDEKSVTNIYSKIVEGEYFEGVSRNPLVIGEKLAHKLKVKLRSKVVLTFQDMDGNITGASFRIAGIFRSSNTMYDEMNLFVLNTDLSHVMLFDKNNAHEIAILLDNNNVLDLEQNALTTEFADYDVKSWRELMPEVALVESSLDLSMYILMIIILLALLFGIINTMLMAVLERIKELGMLMAIGMNKKRIFGMIMIETILLSVVGGVMGIALGWAASEYFGINGIDLAAWAEAYSSLGYDTIIYPVLTLRDTAITTLMVLATGIIAAIYPAMKALKLKPAEAIRIDM